MGVKWEDKRELKVSCPNLYLEEINLACLAERKRATHMLVVMEMSSCKAWSVPYFIF